MVVSIRKVVDSGPGMAFDYDQVYFASLTALILPSHPQIQLGKFHPYAEWQGGHSFRSPETPVSEQEKQPFARRRRFTN
jgi:hypothetical protein